MITVRVCSKLKTSWKLVVFTNKVGKNSRYFVDVFLIKQLFHSQNFPITLKGNSKRIFVSSLAPEQGYQCCFADATNQGQITSAKQATLVFNVQNTRQNHYFGIICIEIVGILIDVSKTNCLDTQVVLSVDVNFVYTGI